MVALFKDKEKLVSVGIDLDSFFDWAFRMHVEEFKKSMETYQSMYYQPLPLLPQRYATKWVDMELKMLSDFQHRKRPTADFIKHI